MIYIHIFTFKYITTGSEVRVYLGGSAERGAEAASAQRALLPGIQRVPLHQCLQTRTLSVVNRRAFVGLRDGTCMDQFSQRLHP